MDVNARNKRGKTVLMISCKNDSDQQIWRLLVENGAIINSKDNMGHDAFDYLMAHSEFGMAVKTFSELGFDINEQDEIGMTKLMKYANRCDTDTDLGKYANFFIKDHKDRTVLDHATSDEDFNAAKNIVEQQTKTLLTHSILMLRTKQIPFDIEQTIMEFVCPGISSSSYGKYKAWNGVECHPMEDKESEEVDEEFSPMYFERHMDKIWDYIHDMDTSTDMFECDEHYTIKHFFYGKDRSQFDNLLRLEMRAHKDLFNIHRDALGNIWADGEDANYSNIVYNVLKKLGVCVRREACVDWKCAGFFTSVLDEIERGEERNERKARRQERTMDYHAYDYGYDSGGYG